MEGEKEFKKKRREMEKEARTGILICFYSWQVGVWLELKI